MQYGLTTGTYELATLSPIAFELYPLEYQKKKKMYYVTLGLSFMVNL